ncbi:DUF3558 family protein [Actinomycetes bacterium KLBMP 9759]
MIRRVAALLLGAVLLVACTHPVAPSAGGSAGSPLPPRPRELGVDELDLCSVLDAAAREALGVSRGEYGPANQVVGDFCRWSHYPSEPVESYYVVRERDLDAATGLLAPRGATMEVIAGFGAVVTQGQYDDPNTGCLILIDAAKGKTLKVSYGYNGSTVPMTRDIACGKARKAAELVLGAILARG